MVFTEKPYIYTHLIIFACNVILRNTNAIHVTFEEDCVNNIQDLPQQIGTD